MKKLIIATAVATSLLVVTGCSLLPGHQAHEKIRKSIGEDEALVKATQGKERRYRYIFKSNEIFAPPVTKADSQKPEWWFTDLEKARGRKMPLEDAIDMVLDQSKQNLNVKFEHGIDREKKVSFKGGSIGEALESIEAASGYSVNVLKNNVISWTEFETRTFHIATVPGVEVFGQGKQGGGETESDNSNIASEDEFASASGGYDALTELYEELRTYSSFTKGAKQHTTQIDVASTKNAEASSLEGDGLGDSVLDAATESVILEGDEIPIYMNKSVSTITVRDRPYVLDQMERIVNDKNNLFRTQVEINVDIISVKLDSEHSESFDLALAIDSASKGIQLATGTAAGSQAVFANSLSSTANKWVAGAEVTKGALSGTQALVEMLSSVGAVSTRMLPSATAHHNSVAKLRDIDSISYIEERSAVQSVNAGTEFTIEQERLDVGFSLFVMPSVWKNEVNIRMATNLSVLIDLVKNGDTDTNEDGETTSNYVESPHIQHRDFYSRFTIGNGETMMIAGLSNESKSVRENQAVAGLAGNAKKAETERIETVIAITAKIQRPRGM